jgi:hypothetical protein
MDVKDETTGHGNHASAGAITLDTYPSAASSCEIYQDGRVSEIRCSYQYPLLKFEVPAFSKRVIIRVNTPPRTPSQVTLNGRVLTRMLSQSAFDSSAQGWFLTSDGRVLVRYPANTSAVVKAW